MAKKDTISPADAAVEKLYAAAKPMPFGNLHERMKFLVQELEKARELDGSDGLEFDQKYGILMMAIYDLVTEVKYHKPEMPPFGRRTLPKKLMTGIGRLSDPK